MSSSTMNNQCDERTREGDSGSSSQRLSAQPSDSQQDQHEMSSCTRTHQGTSEPESPPTQEPQQQQGCNNQKNHSSATTKRNDSQVVTVVLQDGTEMECSQRILRESSGYFDAMLAVPNRFEECRSHRVQLVHLDPWAVRSLLNHVQNDDEPKKNGSDCLLLDLHVEAIPGENTHARHTSLQLLLQAMDYLQMKATPRGDPLVQAIQILCDPKIVYNQCLRQGWVGEGILGGTGRVFSMPVRNQMHWRVWVGFLLFLGIFPEPLSNPICQEEFAQHLRRVEYSAGPKTLTSEFLDYGLVEQSSGENGEYYYWRPVYTIGKVLQWLEGGNRQTPNSGVILRSCRTW